MPFLIRCVCFQGILERLNAGEVVVGDGGYVLQLERRGYVKAGHWTPEAAVEHPEAGTNYSSFCFYCIFPQLIKPPVSLSVRQLHREFLRAGADVMQTFTFYCSEDKLEISGNVTNITVSKKSTLTVIRHSPCHQSGIDVICSCLIQGAQINKAACDLAREVASEGDALVAGCVSKTPCYENSHSETAVKAIFKKQMDDFLKKDIDFFIAEVWAATQLSFMLLLHWTALIIYCTFILTVCESC